MIKRLLLAFVVLAVLFIACGLACFPACASESLPDFDRRRLGTNPVVLNAIRQARAEQLSQEIPGIQIDLEPVLIAPRFVFNRHGFLTPPASEARIRHLARIRVELAEPLDPLAPVTGFLDQNRDLFGYGATVLTNARIKADYVTRHSGMRTIVWEQQVKGIPVFEGLLIAHISRNGELVSLGSDFVPDPEAAAEAGHPDVRNIQLDPPVVVSDAVVAAANTAGENLRSEDFERLDVAPLGEEKRERFRASALSSPAVANLVWLPTNRVAMRLCWQVTVEGKARGDFYQVLVDAQSSEALVRRCWTSGFEPASYRVFASGSPTPWFHSTNQPPRRSRATS